MQKTTNNEGLMLYHRALSYTRIIRIIVLWEWERGFKYTNRCALEEGRTVFYT